MVFIGSIQTCTLTRVRATRTLCLVATIVSGFPVIAIATFFAAGFLMRLDFPARCATAYCFHAQRLVADASPTIVSSVAAWHQRPFHFLNGVLFAPDRSDLEFELFNRRVFTAIPTWAR